MDKTGILNITELANTVEAHYRQKWGDGDFDSIYSKAAENIHAIIQAQKEESITVHRAVIHSFGGTPDDDKSVTETQQDTMRITVLAGFRMEQEKQKEQKNETDWEDMCTLAIETFKEFFLPEGAKDIKVMSVNQFIKEAEEIYEGDAPQRKSFLRLLLTNSIIYYPLTLPFQIFSFICIVVLAIKHAMPKVKEFTQGGEPIKAEKIALKVLENMPKITRMKYYYHHIIIGVLLWILFIKGCF